MAEARPPERFEEAYQDRPPWDIGEPQPALARLVEAGTFSGKVLDVGCGTGELALLAARHDCDATGIDIAPSAIRQAKAKAAERGVDVAFQVHDALELQSLGERFDAVVDSGVFHVFDDADRKRFVKSLHAALRPGGDYWMLVFSEREPTDWGGPRRISREEVEASFRSGWDLVSMERSRFAVTLSEVEGHAWLVHLRRI